MSFILDALRKSETERQREAAPDLARIPLAAPRPRMPRWAIACIGLLTIGIVVLAAAWWRAETSGPPMARMLPPAPESSEATPARDSATRPAVRAARSEPERPTETLPEPIRPATLDATARAEPSAGRSAPTAASAPGNAASTLSSPTSLETPALSLPNLAQIRASGLDVPALDLQLHSYSDDPERRFVFINGQRYGEGEQTAAGPRVLRIVAEGAVLSQLGREFLLTVE